MSTDVDTRVAQVLRHVDPSWNEVVLWVPGTSEDEVPREFVAEVRAKFGHDPLIVRYDPTWNFAASVPQGEAVLQGVLDGLRGQRVLVAGQSQGAWVISDVLGDNMADGRVERVALLGHPGSAADHYPSTPGGRVLEINHQRDTVPRKLNGDQMGYVQALDGLHENRDVLRNTARLIWGGLRNPGYIASVVTNQMDKLPLIGKYFTDPHDYTGDMERAADHLAGDDFYLPQETP